MNPLGSGLFAHVHVFIYVCTFIHVYTDVHIHKLFQNAHGNVTRAVSVQVRKGARFPLVVYIHAVREIQTHPRYIDNCINLCITVRFPVLGFQA